MESIKSNLYPCAHCEGTGTCKNGLEGKSCASCIKKNELKGKDHSGLLCGSCGGIGLAEPLTERINKRTKPLLAMSIVFVVLVIVAVCLVVRSDYFSEVLVFASTLIGSITGYYFSSNKMK